MINFNSKSQKKTILTFFLLDKKLRIWDYGRYHSHSYSRLRNDYKTWLLELQLSSIFNYNFFEILFLADIININRALVIHYFSYGEFLNCHSRTGDIVIFLKCLILQFIINFIIQAKKITLVFKKKILMTFISKNSH